MAAAGGRIIHDGWSVEQALHSFAADRGRDMEYLSRYL
jgi:hypothetical protein